MQKTRKACIPYQNWMFQIQTELDSFQIVEKS